MRPTSLLFSTSVLLFCILGGNCKRVEKIKSGQSEGAWVGDLKLDLGAIVGGEVKTFEVNLKNCSPKPVTLLRLDSSCGCLTVNVPFDAKIGPNDFITLKGVLSVPKSSTGIARSIKVVISDSLKSIQPQMLEVSFKPLNVRPVSPDELDVVVAVGVPFEAILKIQTEKDFTVLESPPLFSVSSPKETSHLKGTRLLKLSLASTLEEAEYVGKIALEIAEYGIVNIPVRLHSRKTPCFIYKNDDSIFFAGYGNLNHNMDIKFAMLLAPSDKLIKVLYKKDEVSYSWSKKHDGTVEINFSTPELKVRGVNRFPIEVISSEGVAKTEFVAVVR